VGRDGKLHGRVTLGALVGPDTLRGLCGQFARLHGVGCLVVDRDGSLLHGEFVGSTATRRRPEGDLTDLPPADEKMAIVATPTGCEYLRARLDNQLEPVGELLLGPYFPAETGIGAELAGIAAPRLSRHQATAALAFLVAVIEEIVFANYQSQLTSHMYMELCSAASGELAERERELRRFDDTLHQSVDLRSLF